MVQTLIKNWSIIVCVLNLLTINLSLMDIFDNYLCSFLMGLLSILVWAVVIYRMKPKLAVEKVEFLPELKVTVANNGCYDAVNLKVEACVVEENYTYHFEIDRADFIAIPHKKRCQVSGRPYERVFKSHRLAESAAIYQEDIDSVRGKLHTGESILRIRIHACHSFTGFGRLQEYKFRYDAAKGLFVKA